MFTKDRPVGYTREGLVTVGMNTVELGQHYEALRAELIDRGIAENVAASSLLPTQFNHNNGLDWRGKTKDQDAIMFRNVNVTPDFGRTLGWRILQGRDFSRAYLTDSSAIILNDTAARIIGIKNPIGEIVTFFGRQWLSNYPLPCPDVLVDLRLRRRRPPAYHLDHRKLPITKGGAPKPGPQPPIRITTATAQPAIMPPSPSMQR